MMTSKTWADKTRRGQTALLMGDLTSSHTGQDSTRCCRRPRRYQSELGAMGQDRTETVPNKHLVEPSPMMLHISRAIMTGNHSISSVASI